MHRSRTAGFSLVEILVVIVVIAVLGAIVVPNTIRAGDTARVSATAEDLRIIARAVETYRGATGRWPRETGRAVLPAELADAFRSGDPFSKAVPIGGVYDYDAPTATRGCRIGIRSGTGNPIPPVEVIAELDAAMDDGDPATGLLRREGDGVFYYLAKD